VPGSRSPSVAMAEPSQPAGNPLKVSIALGQGKQPAIIQKGPFYLTKPDPIVMSEVTGATNLMHSKNLEHSYTKLASKKMKDSLSSFLPGLPGVIDSPSSQDNSSLRGLMEKPPVCGKELLTLNQLQLAGFRLHPGPLPEQYRAMLNQVSQSKKEKKQKKNKKHRGGGETPAHEEGGRPDDDRDRKREKKHKKHDRESEERKKKKKDKKKKKSKEEKDM